LIKSALFLLLLLKWKFFETLSAKLLEYGWVGVFGLSLLDSAFVPLPSGPDALLVTLSIQNSLPRIILLVLAATVGSTLGCVILYFIARRGGEPVLKRVSIERRKNIEKMLNRYDAFTLIFISVMPPPFPVKPFILLAGVLNFKLYRFIIGLLIGRGLRYAILGALAYFLGEAAKDILKKYGPQVLIALVAAGALIILIRYLYLRRMRNSEVEKSLS
jgi:membrane protein YqaA with SNARE-associated domain